MAHRKHAHFLLALIQALCTCAFAQQVPLDTLRATWNDTALPPGIRVPALAQWLDRDSTLALTTAIGSVLPPGSDTSTAVYARQRGLALLAQGSAHAYNGRAAEALRYSRSAVKLWSVWATRWTWLLPTAISGGSPDKRAFPVRRCSTTCMRCSCTKP
ncbi:MAG: hypothetical protein IPG69_12795 [Flavobacteriales bacterium]|nr:hypothetical protein [Flavobacteriales bacterium]